MVSIETDSVEARDRVTVIVFAPSEVRPREFSFLKTESISAAAKHAATEFGLHPTDPSFQTKAGDVLDATETLEQAGVTNGEELDLVDVGGGV